MHMGGLHRQLPVSAWGRRRYCAALARQPCLKPSSVVLTGSTCCWAVPPGRGSRITLVSVIDPASAVAVRQQVGHWCRPGCCADAGAGA